MTSFITKLALVPLITDDSVSMWKVLHNQTYYLELEDSMVGESEKVQLFLSEITTFLESLNIEEGYKELEK